MKKRKVGQLLWWGEFITRVTSIDQNGVVTSLQGGPVLGDGSFDPQKLRNLGIAGYVHVSIDYLKRSPRPMWVRMLTSSIKCAECGYRSIFAVPCECCGCCSFSIHGLQSCWIHIYSCLWLFNGNDLFSNKGLRGWMNRNLPMLANWISRCGHGFMCNNWTSLKDVRTQTASKIEWLNTKEGDK